MNKILQEIQLAVGRVASENGYEVRYSDQHAVIIADGNRAIFVNLSTTNGYQQGAYRTDKKEGGQK